MGRSIAAGVGAYAAVLLALWWWADISAVAYAVFFGAVPALLLLSAAGNPQAAPASRASPGSPALVRRASTAAFSAAERDGRSPSAEGHEEGLEWLNFLIVQLWPHLAKYTEDLIRSFEPTLQQTVPGVGIRFGKCSLGKKPMKLGPITPRRVQSFYGDHSLENGGVELEIGVTYQSDVDVVLATRLASIGVANLTVSGTISVLLRPFINNVPLIGGLEVVFTNPPSVDVDFRGIGNLADLPGIYGTVRKLIDDSIAGIMVLPHRIAVPISDDPGVDLARLKNPPPEGVLRITAVRAAELAGQDFHALSKRTSDPYVRVKLGGETWQTPPVRGTCDPVWTQGNVHDFLVYSIQQWVQIDLFDWDHIGADDPLGSVNRLPVHTLIEQAGKGLLEFKLEARTGSREDPPPPGARLFLEAEWMHMSGDLAGPEVEGLNKYMLELKVDECTGLPSAGLFAPFRVRLRIKGSEDRGLCGSKGWAKPVVMTGTLRRIRKLAGTGVDTPVIAEALELDEAMVARFLSEEAKLKRLGSSLTEKQLKAQEATDRQWLAKLSANRRDREMSCNPQFEEVLIMPLGSREVTAVVELLNDPAKRPKAHKDDLLTGVVARFEVNLGNEDTVVGPFALLDPTTGREIGDGKQMAMLYGTLGLMRLEPAGSKNTKVMRDAFKMLFTTGRSPRANRADEEARRPREPPKSLIQKHAARAASKLRDIGSYVGSSCGPRFP